MKKHVCQVCGYINLADDLPENCPVCHAPKEQFKEMEGAIQMPEDPAELTDLEKKHIPLIFANRACGLIDGCLDLHVKMGEIVHPMLPEHYMTSIDFYLDKQFLSRVILTPEKLNPAAGLHLKADSGSITVISHCNVHGSYIAEKDIE
ncbi:desulfoferrodoxin family protein [Elusimicrobiota bacterium]